MKNKLHSLIILAIFLLFTFIPQVIHPEGDTQNGLFDYDPYRNFLVCVCPQLTAQCYCHWVG